MQRLLTCCIGLLSFLAVPSVAVGAEAPAEATYEFLSRQGALLFDYGKFDEATIALSQACATPEGGRDFECWRKLASAAERADRVGVAVSAWEAAAALPSADAAVARRELQRLRAAFGSVIFDLPVERSLPSYAGTLGYEGLLIDPALKTYLSAVQTRVQVGGFDRTTVWLPAGEYHFEGVAFRVSPGQSVSVALPPRLVPYRAAAFRVSPQTAGRPAGGPWELGVDVEVAGGGAPGGGLGTSPVTVGGRVRFGRRLGPVRVEAALRIGGTPVASATDDVDGDRAGVAWQSLGVFDVGVDLGLGRGVYLTPHGGVVGGGLGEVLVQCRAIQSSSGFVYDGECRSPSLAIGGTAGVDLSVSLSKRGRLALRAGLAGEALSAGVTAVPGARLQGALGVDVVKLERWRFTWMRGSLDVGLSLRF